MYSSICWYGSDTGLRRQFGMFARQLDEGIAPRGFSSGALHDPLRRLEVNCPDGNAELRRHVLPDVVLNRLGQQQILGVLDFGDDDQILGAKRWIEPANCNRAAIVHSRMAANDLFNIVWIDVPASD